MEGECECSLVDGEGSMDRFNEFVGVRLDVRDRFDDSG